MASFTDTPTQFNPYVQQLPVEAMVKVGMYKQEKYEEGITKIQGYIDNIAGLDIYKDVHKQYLQSKLNELGNNISKVAGGDFSNFQLVNSVTGMASQIIKDPVIQNAVSSTAKIKKEQETVEADKKAGKLDPSNQLNWTKQLSSWSNDGDLTSPFSGAYTPYFDVFKFAKESFDAVLPDGMTWDEIYQKGADGKPLTDKKGNLIYSPTMTRMKKEGRFPEKVRATLEQIFSDPKVSQQLSITGEYDYRNYGVQDLAKKIVNQKTEVLQAYNDKLTDLYADKKNGKDVQAQIDAIQSRITTTTAGYDSYIKQLESDPDSVRGSLYKDDVSSRYTTMFGQIKTEQQVLENPAWNQEFKLQQEANDIKQWEEQKKIDLYKFGKEEEWRQKNYDQAERFKVMDLLGKNKGKGVGSGTGPGGNTPEQGDQPSDLDIEFAFDHDYSQAADEFMNQSDPFIWNNSGLGANPQNTKFVDFWMNKGLSQNQAIKKALDDMATKSKMSPEEFRVKWSNSAVTKYNSLTSQEKEKNPQLVNQYNAFKTSKRNFDGVVTVKKEIDRLTNSDQGKVKQQADAMAIFPKEQVIKYDGEDVTLTREDMYNISLFTLGRGSALGGLTVSDAIRKNSNDAKKRLQAKGLLGIAEAIVDETRVFGGKGMNFLKNPYSGLGSLTRSAWRDPAGAFLPFGNTDVVTDLSKKVEKVTDMMQNIDLAGTSKKRADIIKKAYGIQPNLKVGIMTGDNETDLNTLANVKRFAGAYTAGQKMNYSGDFSSFASSLNDDPKKNNLEAGITLDGNNNPVIEIISYKSDGSRAGGMTMQPDEAAKLNLDINSLYEPKEISILRNKINFNKGQSSAGDPREASTYIQGDAWYEKSDFPALVKSKDLDVKGNIIQGTDGMYYPFVYVSDGVNKPKVRMLPGDPSLQGAVYKMKDVDPTLASKILKEK
jgi:hypothetical protein